MWVILLERVTIQLNLPRFSANVTIGNSGGLVQRNDPAYINIPLDSRRPPAPIEPSGTYLALIYLQLFASFIFNSFQMVLYLICASLECQTVVALT